jgi:hypothetical protein
MAKRPSDGSEPCRKRGNIEVVDLVEEEGVVEEEGEVVDLVEEEGEGEEEEEEGEGEEEEEEEEDDEGEGEEEEEEDVVLFWGNATVRNRYKDPDASNSGFFGPDDE